MELLQTLKLILTQPVYLVLFMTTVPGLIYLAFLLTAAICLAIAVRRESREVLKAAYCLQILPCACAVWHDAVSDELIAMVSQCAIILFTMMMAITLVVHYCNRHLFQKKLVVEREWPANAITE